MLYIYKVTENITDNVFVRVLRWAGNKLLSMIDTISVISISVIYLCIYELIICLCEILQYLDKVYLYQNGILMYDIDDINFMWKMSEGSMRVLRWVGNKLLSMIDTFSVIYTYIYIINIDDINVW